MHLEFDDARSAERPQRTIILMGLRGCGKSTVGKRLASRLGLPFVDLDQRTPRFVGETSVADIFSKHGEPAFRHAEFRALEAALREPPAVLALGGGTPTAPGAAQLLRTERAADRVTVMYLRAGPITLRARLQDADNAERPPLTSHGTLEEVETIFALRDPLYRALASHIVEVGSLDAARVAAFIAAKLAASD